MKELCSAIVFFPCKDIKETLHYYRDILGFDIEKDLGGSIWVDGGSGFVGFVQYDPPRDMAKGACISFNLSSTEAVDEMYEKLKNLPVTGLKEPPQKHPKFPVYSFFLSDPNGYLLEFQKPLE